MVSNKLIEGKLLFAAADARAVLLGPLSLETVATGDQDY
jgi:hypothetical protein